MFYGIFGKSRQKLEIKSPENVVFDKFNYIDPSGHFDFYEFFRGSNFYNSFSSLLKS